MTNRNDGQRCGRLFYVLAMLGLFITACGGSTTSSDQVTPAAVDQHGYAVYVDTNGNGVNDYLEQAPYHDPGAGAPPHAFVDVNGDGICDYAQNGSQSWHGPGYSDANGDGICDHWQQGGPQSPQSPGGSSPWCW